MAVLSLPAAQSVGSTPTDPRGLAPAAAAAVRTESAARLGLFESSVSQAGVSADVMQLALGAVTCAVTSGDIAPPPTLTVIDYSRPSVEPRLWVFDMTTGELLFKELVAHGRNTGENLATSFSDAMNSHQSSLGLFVTRDTYVGTNGYSLRLDGLEPGFNSHARERAIVMHGAPYVSEGFVKANGRLGRSWGCPAVRQEVAKKIINTVRGGSALFAYYPEKRWLATSEFFGRKPKAVLAKND